MLRFSLLLPFFSLIVVSPSFAQELLHKGAPAQVGALVIPRADTTMEGQLTVTDIWVDKTSKNAVVARDEAIVDARRFAFMKLALANMTPEEYKALKVPDDRTLKNLVQDFELSDEQLSSNRYVAKFTVRFRDGVRRLIPVVDKPADAVMTTQSTEETTTAKSSPADLAADAAAAQDIAATRAAPAAGIMPAGAPLRLLLPYFENIAGKTVLWEDPNPWREAWQSSMPKSAGRAIVVPVGDASDVSAGPVDTVWSGHYGTIEKLRQNYHADEVVLTIANKSGPYLTLDMYFFSDGKLRSREVLQPYVGEKTDAEAWQQGMNEVIAYLAKMPAAPARSLAAKRIEDISRELTGKSAANDLPTTVIGETTTTVPASVYAPAARGKMDIEATMRFSTPRDWLETQRRLNAMTPPATVDVKSISSNGADFTLHYPGSIDMLQQALAQKGISLGLPVTTVNPGMTPTGTAQRQVYDLRLAN